MQSLVALNASKSHQSISKLLGAGGGSTIRTTSRIDDEDMATSFLQYWYVFCRSMVLVLIYRSCIGNTGRPASLPSARLLVPFVIRP